MNARGAQARQGKQLVLDASWPRPALHQPPPPHPLRSVGHMVTPDMVAIGTRKLRHVPPKGPGVPWGCSQRTAPGQRRRGRADLGQARGREADFAVKVLEGSSARTDGRSVSSNRCGGGSAERVKLLRARAQKSGIANRAIRPAQHFTAGPIPRHAPVRSAAHQATGPSTVRCRSGTSIRATAALQRPTCGNTLTLLPCTEASMNPLNILAGWRWPPAGWPLIGLFGAGERNDLAPRRRRAGNCRTGGDQVAAKTSATATGRPLCLVNLSTQRGARRGTEVTMEGSRQTP